MATVGSVFNDEADVELSRLRNLAAALASPGFARTADAADSASIARNSDGSYRVELGLNDTLSRDSVTQLLADIANEAASAMQSLTSAMEDHFVRFFTHLKKRNDDELALWMPKPDAVNPEKAGANRNLPTQNRAKAPSSQVAQAVDHLHTWLAIELESVVTSSHATKGAVYLRSSAGGGYLRRVASIPAKLDLPADVALASGSTIGTVVQTGVGATVAKSRKEAMEEAARREGRAAVTSAVPFNVSTAVVLPLVVPSASQPIGCIVIADKAEPGQPYFTVADEHRAWAFAAACEGVFARYPHSTLLSYAPSRDLPTILSSVSRIASVSDASAASSQGPLTVHGVPIPTKAKKLMILRAGTSTAAQAAKDSHMVEAAVAVASREATNSAAAAAARRVSMLANNSTAGFAPEASTDVPPSPSATHAPPPQQQQQQTSPSHGGASSAHYQQQQAVNIGAVIGSVAFNDEDVLESVAPYVRNVEMMWHASLETVMKLRNECASWEDKVAGKEAQIVDLEVAMKNLAKQLHRTKADIRRLQRLAPQHLREALGGPDGLVTQSIPGGPLTTSQGDQQQQLLLTDGGGGASSALVPTSAGPPLAITDGGSKPASGSGARSSPSHRSGVNSRRSERSGRKATPSTARSQVDVSLPALPGAAAAAGSKPSSQQAGGSLSARPPPRHQQSGGGTSTSSSHQQQRRAPRPP